MIFMLQTYFGFICPIPTSFQCESCEIGVSRFVKLLNSSIAPQGPIPAIIRS